MWETLKDFGDKVMNAMFPGGWAVYYLAAFIGFVGLVYLVAFIVSFCGRLSKIRKMQKKLIEDFSPEQMEAALDKMPKELSYAYISARERRVNPLSVFTFESCVRTPFSMSFASRFVKFTVVFTLLMSLITYTFFNTGFARTGLSVYRNYAWYGTMAISVFALFAAALAAVISSSRHRKAVKRYEIFAEAVALADVSRFMHSNAKGTERTVPKGNVDEFVEGVSLMCKEGASLASLKEAAYQLQQMRSRPENSDPLIQHKLNETVNLVVKAMATALRNQ